MLTYSERRDAAMAGVTEGALQTAIIMLEAQGPPRDVREMIDNVLSAEARKALVDRIMKEDEQ